MPNRNLVVGIFVLAGVLLFATGLFIVGNRHKAFDKHMEFYTGFSNLGGLAKGAKVKVSGMDAGEVLEIEIPSSPASRFRVKLKVESSLRGLIRTDSVASVATEGVVGDTFVSIKTGSTGAPEAADHSTLPSKEPFDFAALLDKGNGLLNDAGKTIKDADSTIQQVGGDLHTALGSVDQTVGNVNDVVVGVKQGRGAIGLLLRDKRFSGEVRQTLDSAKTASDSLAHASGQADKMITDLNSRDLPQKADDTMNSAKSAAAQLDSTAHQLNQTIADATSPDNNGQTAGANLRESLANVNNATGNLSDDTEALKHEFFFKGFFKKRGYYQLSGLSPEAYRRDKIFSSPANRRLWLSPGDLFQSQNGSPEELSASGKLAIDAALSQAGGDAIDSPMVVEGYASTGDVAEQVAVSRRRSILITAYLRNHFQLDPRDIGSIALGNTVPAKVNRTSPEGICIVLLKVKA